MSSTPDLKAKQLNIACRARLGCSLRPRLMQLDERELRKLRNQAGGSRRYSANFFPCPSMSAVWGSLVLMSLQILACLLQSAQICLSDGQVFFLRCSCSYTSSDSPRLWRSCAARDQCDARIPLTARIIGTITVDMVCTLIT